MKATLSNYRQSPRKVRLVANAISGKSADQALITLRFLVKRGAAPMEKLLKSAIANAKAIERLEPTDLIVKSVMVNKGIVLKRMMPRAMGSGSRINKRTSHIDIVLAPKVKKSEKAEVAPENPVKEKKVATKKLKAKS